MSIYILYTGRELEDIYSVSMGEYYREGMVVMLTDIDMGDVGICGRYWHGYIGMENICIDGRLL